MQSYFMWDSFMSGVASSILKMGTDKKDGENDFAEMEYMNITVITSNKPYGISDGSNPLFDAVSSVSKFNVERGGVHSGHVQTGFQDPFCINNKGGKGKCKVNFKMTKTLALDNVSCFKNNASFMEWLEQDGYTPEGTGGVRVLVATKAKPNVDTSSPLDKEFFKSFLDVNNLQINQLDDATIQFKSFFICRF